MFNIFCILKQKTIIKSAKILDQLANIKTSMQRKLFSFFRSLLLQKHVFLNTILCCILLYFRNLC
uniref:Uncharacterized protein n=1 Tax=Arundo donax TaxID=35708 RepID=A0A0A9H7D9_ARUDO